MLVVFKYQMATLSIYQIWSLTNNKGLKLSQMGSQYGVIT